LCGPFPIAVFGLIALIANVGAPFALYDEWRRRGGEASFFRAAMPAWRFFAIIWAGAAFGVSRWGDFAGTMGARNTPYFDVLFAPWIISAQRLFG